ncbi:MAG: hypothetical protein AVDCRST_MAG96-1023 [uncultured Segetibacter sp.]|uniref:Uncharacterized protein n=1 Tax=uncultured Segetibacter sp. TaxID=481133 RepID=A0A6J4RTP6_9BACT|nr:MAG: hypothetical protein AVDCRST_MAG96-1023 [uncultured Segetibacter sp.]
MKNKKERKLSGVVLVGRPLVFSKINNHLRGLLAWLTLFSIPLND